VSEKFKHFLSREEATVFSSMTSPVAARCQNYFVARFSSKLGVNKVLPNGT